MVMVYPFQGQKTGLAWDQTLKHYAQPLAAAAHWVNLNLNAEIILGTQEINYMFVSACFLLTNSANVCSVSCFEQNWQY